MGFFAKIDKSVDLMNGLAERMDVDLTAQILANPDTAAQTYRSMVMACSGCSAQDACTKLQATHAHLDQAPDYCRNRAALNGARTN